MSALCNEVYKCAAVVIIRKIFYLQIRREELPLRYSCQAESELQREEGVDCELQQHDYLARKPQGK